MDSFSAVTDPGRKRKNNQDSILADPAVGIYVVADGVGGRLGGDRASALCVEIFKQRAPALQHLVSHHARDPGEGRRNQVLEAVDSVCQEASRAVYEMGIEEGFPGTSTTLALALVGGGFVFVAHAGDSRVYLYRSELLRRLTEDHSMVNELVNQGKMTAQDARKSSYRHVITRALGNSPFVQVDLACTELLPGDRLLVCSDGLSDPVEPEDLQSLTASGTPEEVVPQLLNAALEAGGPDNISIIVVDPQTTPEAERAIARAKVLGQFFLFEDLPFSALQRVSLFMSEVNVAPGQEILTQGAGGQRLFAVVQGKLEVTRDGMRIAEIGPGDHFGELSLTDSLPRSATVTATTIGRLLTIDRIQVDRLCRREPELGTRILWNLLRASSERLRDTTARLASGDFHEPTLPLD
ncbi:MAG: cyclic nucleotide-binding domain-containing protein [Myxococcota bacterium]|nr:cyclic nucleotide-binding domain-containing protein [Myxococcota bacterium]